MLRTLEKALDDGALGLSTGLEYTPGRYTPTDEIVALARVVAQRGGFYASHIRNEERQLLEAVDEAVRIGRLSGARVQVSHVKASGRGNWGKQVSSLALIESARRDGVEVLGDAYPYTAYSTGLTVTFPSWALDGGTEAMLKRLRGPERDRIRARGGRLRPETATPGDYDLIVIAGVRERGQPALRGPEPRPGGGGVEGRGRRGPPAHGGRGTGRRFVRGPRHEPGERGTGARPSAGDGRLGRARARAPVGARCEGRPHPALLWLLPAGARPLRARAQGLEPGECGAQVHEHGRGPGRPPRPGPGGPRPEGRPRGVRRRAHPGRRHLRGAPDLSGRDRARPRQRRDGGGERRPDRRPIRSGAEADLESGW